MFPFLKQRIIKKYSTRVEEYLQQNYLETASIASTPKYSTVSTDNHIKYSDRDSRGAGSIDSYSIDRVNSLLRNASFLSLDDLNIGLERSLNITFSGKLIQLIRQKGMRDSEVYRAAQMDRRLFSKIISSNDFKPSKDTVLALIFALRLTMEQAEDLLSRAGYTLSHSNKRDVIIEFFIREGIHRLTDINLVLYDMGQKIIGR